MKTESSVDEFDTQCWVNQVITDPYQVIAESFFCKEMYGLKGIVKKLIECCISPKIYKERPAADVLLYMRIIHSAIKAAHILKEKKSSEIVVDKNDLLNNKYFCCNRMLNDDSTDFPRFLSKKEYQNPYSVFRKFFKYQSLEMWLTIWKNIIDGALCPDESRFFINEILVYTHLVKCIEAAHVIDVRETVHIRGDLKERL